jgi:hypothetical protein
MTSKRCLALLLALALASPAIAQPAQPATTTGSATTATEPSKQCVTARKKAEKEQRSLTTATDSIAHDKKARESCSSKSMCERYDTAISAMEKRQARHETRLARFKEDVANDCKGS